MKNILILGAPRVGKTNLAKKISKELGYIYISLDNIFESIEKLKCWPYPKYFDANIISKELASFTINYINNLDSEYSYVLEGAYLDINELYNKIDVNYIGLTYNELDKYSLFERIKKYDQNTWLNNFDDDTILEKCDCFIKRNNYYHKSFNELKIKSYDLSNSYLEVMEKIIKEIEKD